MELPLQLANVESPQLDEVLTHVALPTVTVIVGLLFKVDVAASTELLVSV